MQLVQETDFFSGSLHMTRHRNATSPHCSSSVLPEVHWLPWMKVLPCFPSFRFNTEMGSLSYIRNKVLPLPLAKYIKYLQLYFTEDL